MKLTLFALAMMTAVAAFAGLAAPAHAQNYPWCAQLGGRDDDGVNCGFVSYQQCMSYISGIGGYCERNYEYVPPPGPHPMPHRRYRR